MMTPEQSEEFQERGFIRVPGAFPADAAAAMVDRLWASLEKRFGVSRTDPATWKLPPGLELRDLRRSSVFKGVGSATTTAALDDLIGEGRWEYPRHWASFLVSFPSRGVPTWTVPGGWHTDWPYRAPQRGPVGALLFSFLSHVPPRHGGTVALEGSPGIVRAFVAQRPRVAKEKMKFTRRALMNSDPWLKALDSDPDDSDRIERFMGTEARIGGIRVRVTELTGEPGDIVIGHPWLLHSGAANCGTQPRFMLVQRIRSA